MTLSAERIEIIAEDRNGGRDTLFRWPEFCVHCMSGYADKVVVTGLSPAAYSEADQFAANLGDAQPRRFNPFSRLPFRTIPQ